MATVLDRAGPQKVKKEKIELNLKGFISLVDVEKFLESRSVSGGIGQHILAVGAQKVFSELH